MAICEPKFYGSEFTIDSTTAMAYRNKLATIKEATQTRKPLFLTKGHSGFRVWRSKVWKSLIFLSFPGR
jgi:hypothetical protein